MGEVLRAEPIGDSLRIRDEDFFPFDFRFFSSDFGLKGETSRTAEAEPRGDVEPRLRPRGDEGLAEGDVEAGLSAADSDNPGIVATKPDRSWVVERETPSSRATNGNISRSLSSSISWLRSSFRPRSLVVGVVGVEFVVMRLKTLLRVLKLRTFTSGAEVGDPGIEVGGVEDSSMSVSLSLKAKPLWDRCFDTHLFALDLEGFLKLVGEPGSSGSEFLRLVCRGLVSASKASTASLSLPGID